MLLVLGTGVAKAGQVVIDTPTGLEGFFSITGFSHTTSAPEAGNVCFPISGGQFSCANPSNTGFSINVDHFRGLGGGNGTLDLNNVLPSQQVQLETKTPIDLYPSPVTPPGNDPNQPGPDKVVVPPGSFFTGQFSADFGGITSLTVGPNLTPSVPNMTFSYDGVLTLIDQILQAQGKPTIGPVPSNGTLALTTVTGPSNPAGTILGITAVETGCTSTFNGKPSCLEQALTLLDAGTANIGTIDDVFKIQAGILLAVPEPTSLALLGVGLAGLGFIRRKKAA